MRDKQKAGELIPAKLSGQKEKSFAYDTLRIRIPTILTKIIDTLHRVWPEFDVRDRDQVYDVMNRITLVKYELEHNRNMTLMSDNLPDCHIWNKLYELETELQKGKAPTYYQSAWLYTECYIYRKVIEAFSFSPALRHFDWFGKQKKEAYYGSLDAIKQISQHFSNLARDSPTLEAFAQLVKVSLWGNKCDLSISAGVASHQEYEVIDLLCELDGKILLDHVKSLWLYITQDCNSTFQIDIILDNAGYELVTDLVFTFFVLKILPSTRIALHCKQHPWFVSDATTYDVTWTLHQMTTSKDSYLQEIANDLNKYMYETQRLTITSDLFWTLPCTIDEMKTYDKPLYRTLSECSQLVIFKGDLNYRKISQDREWVPTDWDFRPDFPTPICAIRTLKANTVFGLSHEAVQKASSTDSDWMTSGKYGVIQFIK